MTERPPEPPLPEPRWYDPGRRDPLARPPRTGRADKGRGGRERRGDGRLLAWVALIAAGAGAAGAAVVLVLGMLVLGPGAGSGTAGSPGPAPAARTVELSAVTAAVDAVSPAVVTITTRAGDGALVAADPFALPATGVGSGIVYDASGLVLTSRHVVCDADALTVRLKDGRELAATTYGIDTLTDLAIVRIAGADDLPVAPIGDSSGIRPGQVAIAIGSPLGTYTNSVTSGVVSATARELTVDDRCGSGMRRTLRGLIQTDAAINPGNSGGALVDIDGRVIGVNTAIEGGSEGIGFAIPIAIARPLMRQAAAGAPLTRPWIGIVHEPITPALADRAGLPVDHGVLVALPAGEAGSAVIPGSPAEAAGIRDGDIVLAIDGVRIDAAAPLDLLLTDHAAGDTLALDVLRGGETIVLRIVLGVRPAQG